ncbi:hypothetical protein CYY_002137 [Polysphondylium violaceum]|uniref:Ankyrin repeat-containing protein n=1 Tax=Polysphondylium violaceum TaxID=133409 RepID=A0A8J4Q8A7_9MYCE|nr:hypothetical protein CYY_002137 [Polysphondylium violaceum]
MDEVFKNGQIEIVHQFLNYNNTGIEISIKAIIWSARNGKTDLLTFAFEIYPHLVSPIENVGDLITESGNLECLQYMIKNYNVGITINSFVIAVQNRDFLMLEFLFNNYLHLNPHPSLIPMGEKNMINCLRIMFSRIPEKIHTYQWDLNFLLKLALDSQDEELFNLFFKTLRPEFFHWLVKSNESGVNVFKMFHHMKQSDLHTLFRLEAELYKRGIPAPDAELIGNSMYYFNKRLWMRYDPQNQDEYEVMDF